MNYDSTNISVIVTFCIISFLIGYSVHGYCNNTNNIVIERLEDDIEHLEQRQSDLEDRSRHITHVVAQPMSPSAPA